VLTLLDARRFDASVEIFFELVMARHFIDLAVFFAEAEPPAFFLRVVILNGECDDGTDAREGIGHYRNDGAVAQPATLETSMPVSSAVASSEESTGVTPLLTEWRGPRTECAGLDGITWPVTSQSNNMRMQARCCLTEGADISRASCST
jgi:hypothetical protein